MISRTAEGRAFRILNIIDEYTMECLAMLVKRHITSQDVPEIKLLDEAIVAYWAEIGVKANMVPCSFTTWMKEVRGRTATGSVFGGTASIRVVPLGMFRAVLHSEGLLAQVEDQKLDALIEEAEATIDLEELENLIKQINRYAYDMHYTGPTAAIGQAFSADPEKIKDWELGYSPMDYNVRYLLRR